MTNIKIKEIAIYHPDNIVANEGYVKHFKERGKDITGFLEAMGRKERYIISNQNENGLTMAIEVSKRVLDKAKMIGKDIDYIVFSSQVPERTIPGNAVVVHDAIQARPQTMAIDTNANCAGMTVAVEQTCRYMLSNPDIHTALVVGSEHLSRIANPEVEISYAMFGDASCAVILEKTEEDTGFVDAKYHIQTTHIDKIIYPTGGLTKSFNGQLNSHYVTFLPFDASFGNPITFKLIEDILQKNNVAVKDIKGFCISQFTYYDTTKIQEYFNVEKERMIYIGDRFGYTGTSSPFIALHEGIKDGRIKRGDYVMFWTVGAGHQFIAMLFKY